MPLGRLRSGRRVVVSFEGEVGGCNEVLGGSMWISHGKRGFSNNDRDGQSCHLNVPQQAKGFV
jgi:hypothetical protein